jgi:hypothetical protein
LPTRKLRIQTLPSDHVEKSLGRGARSAIEEACAALGEVERAVLTPRLRFDPLATVGLETARLAGGTIDPFDLLLAGKRLPPAERLREFHRRLGHLRPRLQTLFCDGDLAPALQPVSSWAVRDRRTAPELFAWIDETAGGGLVTTAGALSVTRPFERSDALGTRARTPPSLFLQPEIVARFYRSLMAPSRSKSAYPQPR